MAYSSLDYYYNQISIPQDKTAPANGSPLQQYIYDRQVAAHVSSASKFAGTMVPILSAFFVGINESNVPEEFEKLKSYILKGLPMPICMSAMGAGHHMVAIGCDLGSTVSIRAYDPNAPEKVAVIQQTPGGKLKNSQSPRLWDAFFVDDGYRKNTPAVFAGQPDWRWCRKCQGLFFAGHSKFGVCPAKGPHHALGSGNYMLALEAGIGQTNWRWCFKCESLFFAGNASRCSGGGAHDASQSGNYTLAYNGGMGQNKWRHCQACSGLFFSGNNTPGVCPTSPAGHYYVNSADYYVPFFSE
jgi:hypothetical protein